MGVGLIRLLLLVALIAGAWFVYRRLKILWRENTTLRANKTEKPKNLAQVQMVRCEHCGLHIPEDEALKIGTAVYCSSEHREAARKT